jgi:hypothetical protein
MTTVSTLAGTVTGSRGLRRALVVAALAAMTIVGSAVPAHASHTFTMTDNFETNPASGWVPHASATGGGHFSNNAQWAHSGSRYAYRWVETGYSSVRRTVHLPTVQTWGSAFCWASIWLRAVTATVNVNFEMIDPDTWTYIGLENVTLAPSAGWQQVFVGRVSVSEPDPVIRAALLGNGSVTDVRIDDLTVHCEVVQ